MGFILFLSYEGFITMDKKRPSDTAFSSSASASKRRNKSEDELKKGSDEAFHLSEDRVVEILILIRSGGGTPNKWDEYATSFYNRTLACKTRFTLLGKHQQVEEETEDDISTDEEEEKVDTQYLSPSEMDGDQDEDMESTHSEEGYCRPELSGPFDFGSYSSGNEPKSIPYHLYLLVKEAVDIMEPFEGCSIDVTKLTLVEEKIWFFCRYFHCHLPTGWEYDRDTARDVVASYDHTHTHRYDMAGYTPITSFEGPLVDDEFDAETELSRNELICVMSVIHSRKTPAYWEMSPGYVLFYCKLCSCFGIDYDCLEAASEEDVRLMYVGLELDP
ncbi:hypothetical protein HanXRQr2_Chr04g0185801 [Helianthus annuus]|uniref:Uncharacterized protein n=1 Tax=Helianthus annuus TaxID=4232 RepID=A0A251V3H7_HELAN|nr:uncharacterized protein LOC110937788 [Helianthus annuus]KAF5811818.1 hypothetical protein HanXRQr2_Chr04g0185801 [Helianthus annuus]